MEQTINLENQNSDQILNQTLNQTSHQKNIFKISFFVLLILFLAVSAVLVFTLSKKNKEKPQLVNKDQESQIVSMVTPTVTVTTPTEVVTTITPTKSTTTTTTSKDWKTYMYRNTQGNPKCKFSFNHPSDWIVKVSENGAWVSNLEFLKGFLDPFNNNSKLGEFVNVYFHENYKTSLTDGKTLDSYLSDKTSFPSANKIKLNNLDGYKVFENGMGGENPAYYIISGDNVYVVSSNNGGDFSETEKQIIDTLKFN